MTIASVIVPDHLDTLDDAALLSLQAQIASSRRQLDALSARVSAEVGRRSASELGYSGLAQRSGARTPEALVQQVTGVSRAEARALIRVGAALDSPWLAPVASAVSSGELSISAADGIVAGLGSPDGSVSSDELQDAAARLVAVAGQTTPERVASAARSIREDLDLDGVTEREEALRAKRFLRLIPQADGMTKLLGLLDPESAATVAAAVDAVTAPRRGGPRFVDEAQAAEAQRIVDDVRTTEQIALDALVDMVRLSVAADPGVLFGTTTPSVRVHVTAAELVSGVGAARVEGQTAALGMRTVQRLACADGYVPVLFDEDRPLDVGRSERLFTWRQRVALAARDGGCVFPGCDRRPPGARPTTSISGRATRAAPTSSAACCSAGTITCCCTSAAAADRGAAFRGARGRGRYLTPRCRTPRCPAPRCKLLQRCRNLRLPSVVPCQRPG